jgi:hypothetical protein
MFPLLPQPPPAWWEEPAGGGVQQAVDENRRRRDEQSYCLIAVEAASLGFAARIALLLLGVIFEVLAHAPIS